MSFKLLVLCSVLSVSAFSLECSNENGVVFKTYESERPYSYDIQVFQDITAKDGSPILEQTNGIVSEYVFEDYLAGGSYCDEGISISITDTTADIFCGVDSAPGISYKLTDLDCQ